MPSLGWCSVLKVHCSDMRMSEEEKEMLSDEKLALIWPEEDLLLLKQKSQTGKQKRKGNNRLPPEFNANFRPNIRKYLDCVKGH